MSGMDGWTVGEACDEFAEAGYPLNPDWFRRLITGLPGLAPCGRTQSGALGGRGRDLYPIRELQDLVTALSPWLKPPGQS